MKDRHTQRQPAEDGDEGRAPAPVPGPTPVSPPPGSTGEFDSAFAEVAVRAGWVDRESVEEALRLKALLKEENPQDYPSLSQISVECGILTTDQARRLMDVIRHIDERRRRTNSGVFPVQAPAADAGAAEASGPASPRFKTQEMPVLPAPEAPAEPPGPTPRRPSQRVSAPQVEAVSVAKPPATPAAAEATTPAASTGPVAVGRCFQLKEGRTPDGTAYMVLVVKGKVGPGDVDEVVEAVDSHWHRFQCDLYVDLAALEVMGQEVVQLLETLDGVARRHDRLMVLGWVPARIRRILPLVKARLKVVRLFPEEGA